MKINFSMLFCLLPLFVCLVGGTWVKEMENPHLFEGDIILEPNKRLANGSFNYASASIIGKRWPNPVPYEFGRDMKRQRRGIEIIKKSMAEYEKYTCIRFKPRTTEKGYMRFDWAPGCASSVGFKEGKVNKINLDSPCWNLGTVMHEMGHSLGLWHEQSHPNRDKYIEILWDNIKEEHKHNFKKHTTDVEDYGTPYDLESMMHYGTAAFSKDGSRTIKTRDYSKRLLIGQRHGFSNLDVVQLNLMYKCPVFRGTVPPKVCVDTGVYDCSKYKRWGRCNDPRYEGKMYGECCRTCFGNVVGKLGESKTWPHWGTMKPTQPVKPTQPTQPGGCRDKSDAKTCAYWKRIGNCTSKSTAIRKFTLDHCCATCKK